VDLNRVDAIKIITTISRKNCKTEQLKSASEYGKLSLMITLIMDLYSLISNHVAAGYFKKY
jgi:hypothetical protein